MALPGTPGQRISDLCNGYPVTQKEHEAEIEKIKRFRNFYALNFFGEETKKEQPVAGYSEGRRRHPDKRR